MKKKLTIITTVRNDDYIINFIDRLQYTINFFLRNCESIEKLNDIEVLIVDWGSKQKISSVFNCYKKKYQNKIKFLEVENKYVKKFSRGVDGGFFTEKAINLGISKAKGDYILYITADTLFSKNSIINIFNLVESDHKKNQFYLIPRKYIDFHFFLSNPNFLEMNRYLENIFFSKKRFENTQFQNGGGATGWIVKKININKINCLDENALSKGYYSGSDAELLKRMSVEFNHSDASNFGVTGFKLPRNNFKGRKSLQNSKKINFVYSLDKERNIKKNYSELKAKVNFSKKISKEINIGQVGIKKELKKNYTLLKIYWHTLLSRENPIDFYINLKLINYINEYKIQNYYNFGLNKMNRFASISKIYSYLNLYSFDIQSQTNNPIKTSNYVRLNRFLNRTHNGYYRFILTTKMEKISKFFIKKTSKNELAIANIDISQFKSLDLKKIIEILSKNRKNFIKIIFENIGHKEEKIIKKSLLLKNFELIFCSKGYLILIKDNYKNMIITKNFFQLKLLFNYLLISFIIMLSSLKSFKYRLKKIFK